jgi:hypothetical protein
MRALAAPAHTPQLSSAQHTTTTHHNQPTRGGGGGGERAGAHGFHGFSVDGKWEVEVFFGDFGHTRVLLRIARRLQPTNTHTHTPHGSRLSLPPKQLAAKAEAAAVGRRAPRTGLEGVTGGVAVGGLVESGLCGAGAALRYGPSRSSSTFCRAAKHCTIRIRLSIDKVTAHTHHTPNTATNHISLKCCCGRGVA